MYRIRSCTKLCKSFPSSSFRGRFIADRPTVLKLKNPITGSDVYVVGTAHISKRSADEVREVINEVNPDTIMVELDPGRAISLWAKSVSESAGVTSARRPAQSPLERSLRRATLPGQSRAGRGLGNALSGFYRLLERFGFKAGGEFVVAMDEARKRDARLVCGDADASATMENMVAAAKVNGLRDLLALWALTPWMWIPMSFGFVMEFLRSQRALWAYTKEVNWALRAISPAIYKAFITDRDQHLAESLFRCPGERVVGVVGMGHLAGISEHWQTLSRSHDFFKSMRGEKIDATNGPHAGFDAAGHHFRPSPPSDRPAGHHPLDDAGVSRGPGGREDPHHQAEALPSGWPGMADARRAPPPTMAEFRQRADDLRSRGFQLRMVDPKIIQRRASTVVRELRMRSPSASVLAVPRLAEPDRGRPRKPPGAPARTSPGRSRNGPAADPSFSPLPRKR